MEINHDIELDEKSENRAVKILKYKQRLFIFDRILFPYYNSLSEIFINHVLTLKYVSTVAFFLAIFSYVTRLDRFFLLLVPIVICNLLIVLLIQIAEWNAFLLEAIGNKKFKKLSDNLRKKIIDNDIEFIATTHIVSFGLHLAMVGIILYLYYTSQFNQINYIENILAGIFMLLVYWLISNKTYGNINEPVYVCVYILCLFMVNYFLFEENKMQFISS